MNPVDNIESRIRQLHATTRAETDRRILDEAFIALRRGAEARSPDIWRKILTSRMTRPAAAAAVVLIAVGLFLSMPSAKSETVQAFYRTLGTVGNACVASFEPGQTDPFRQVWMSDSLKVRLFKTGVGEKAQFALLDVGEKLQMKIFRDRVETEPLTPEKLADLEESMSLTRALAPFSRARDVPEHARWIRVKDPAILATIPGMKVYDLIWVEQVSTSVDRPHRKWRVFIYADTHLPGRAEFYSKAEPEDEFAFERFVIVTYPGEGEIRDIVANTFGSPGSRTGGPEHIGTPGTRR
jgi:hypothetical protein